MQPASDEVTAVLNAADNWVTALEALVAAKQASKKTETEEDAVDVAGTLLVAAVTNWRLAKRTSAANQDQG
jgi:hypothetical protein